MDFDCIIVGGGAAGLSAALTLGRARRTTLLVDAGEQSNLPAHGIGGLLGHDGRPPSELYALGREELAKYPSVEVRDGRVVDAAEGFTVTLDDGTTATAEHLIVATGMTYRRPDVPGIEERWGGSVFHCPFCHGWEVRGKRLGVLDTETHRALLLTAWSDDVTLYTNGAPAPDGPHGIPVDTRPIARVTGPGDDLAEIVFADGDTAACEGLLVAVDFDAHTPLHDLPGVQVAGDATAEMPSLPRAVLSGQLAAVEVVRAMTVDAPGRLSARTG